MGNSSFSENGMKPYVNELIDSSEFTSSEVVDRRIFELRDGGSRRPGWQTAGKLTFTEAEKVFGTVKVN